MIVSAATFDAPISARAAFIRSFSRPRRDKRCIFHRWHMLCLLALTYYRSFPKLYFRQMPTFNYFDTSASSIIFSSGCAPCQRHFSAPGAGAPRLSLFSGGCTTIFYHWPSVSRVAGSMIVDEAVDDFCAPAGRRDNGAAAMPPVSNTPTPPPTGDARQCARAHLVALPSSGSDGPRARADLLRLSVRTPCAAFHAGLPADMITASLHSRLP